MRFQGSDLREILQAVCAPDEFTTVDALMTASASTWEGVAFEARSLMDAVGPDLDSDGEVIAQSMFLGGYLSGLAQCAITGRGDSDGLERAA